MPNYDVIDSKEDYLGLRIRSGVPSQQYKDNYDKIFRKPAQDGNPGSEKENDNASRSATNIQISRGNAESN